MRLKSAIIGTGKISEEHLKFLTRCRHVALAAVCDLSPSLAEYAALRFNAGRPFTDYAAMLSAVKPTIVHVLTPAHTHPRIIGDCMRAGAHVIAEKPIAPTHDEFLKVWELSQRCGRRLIEDHNYRFNPSVLKIEELVNKGQLGEICDVEVRLALGIRKPGGRYADANLPHPSHNLPCGVLHEFVTHLVYLLLRFMPRAEYVTSIWNNYGADELFRYDDLDALVIGGGVHGRVRFSARTQPECFSLMVRGTRGWAETDLYQPFLRTIVPRSGGPQLSPLINHVVNGLGFITAGIAGFRNKIMQRTPLEGLHTFLRLAYESILTDAPSPVSFEDMSRTSRLIDQLVQSRTP